MAGRVRALVLAAALALALAAAPAAGDPFAYRDAGCTAAGDPAQLRFVDLRIAVRAEPDAPAVVLTGAAAARWVVDRLAFHQPGGAASSESWFRFPGGACVPQTAWVTDHGALTGGSHVRFWQAGEDWREVWGAAHRENLCLLGETTLADHQVDDFVGVRDAAAAPFRFLNTVGQGVVFAVSWSQPRPAGLLSKTCGGRNPQMVPDDGMVLEIRQVVPVVAVP
jgi:hypothetical protein